jgi:hypothetical protein
MLEVVCLVRRHGHAAVIVHRYKEILTHCVKQFAQNNLKCKDPRDQALYYDVSPPAVRL